VCKRLMATENPQSYATFMAMSHASPRLTITAGTGEELPEAAQVKDGNHMNQSVPCVIALKETPTS
jgi:hypothetical protein